MKCADRAGREIHHDHGDHHGGDHDLDVLRHADRGDDRIEENTRSTTTSWTTTKAKAAGRRPPLRSCSSRLDLGVDLVRRLGDEKEPAADQDDVAPGNARAEQREQAAPQAASARSAPNSSMMRKISASDRPIWRARFGLAASSATPAPR